MVLSGWFPHNITINFYMKEQMNSFSTGYSAGLPLSFWIKKTDLSDYKHAKNYLLVSCIRTYLWIGKCIQCLKIGSTTNNRPTSVGKNHITKLNKSKQCLHLTTWWVGKIYVDSDLVHQHMNYQQ